MDSHSFILTGAQINLQSAVATSRISFAAILLPISAYPNDEQTIVYRINQRSAKPLHIKPEQLPALTIGNRIEKIL
ncbi:MAG: hypothetical protein DU480_14385 [Nitrosomonas sp.]